MTTIWTGSTSHFQLRQSTSCVTAVDDAEGTPAGGWTGGSTFIMPELHFSPDTEHILRD